MLNVALAAAILGVACVYAEPQFQSKIPNGNNVPHPCKAGSKWGPVGHYGPNKYGKQYLNLFGKAFGAARGNWVTLCPLDSDFDGWTNGEELGDPDCTWSGTGPAPAANIDLGHPGVCEPVNHPGCKAINDFLVANNADCTAKVNEAYKANATLNRPRRTQKAPTARPSSSPAAGRGTTPSNRPAPGNRVLNMTSPWKLRQECICYCLDMPEGMGGGRMNRTGPGRQGGPGGPGGFRPRPVDEDDDDSGDDEDGDRNGGDDDDDTGNERTLGGRRRPNRRPMGGNGGNNGKGGQNGWGGPTGGNGGQNGWGGMGGGPMMSMMMPPLNQTAEFSDTDNYDTPLRPCVCTCKKGS